MQVVLVVLMITREMRLVTYQGDKWADLVLHVVWQVIFLVISAHVFIVTKLAVRDNSPTANLIN